MEIFLVCKNNNKNNKMIILFSNTNDGTRIIYKCAC